jgi:hypothetical protein
LFIPKSHLARTVPQVHDRAELQVKRNGRKCEHREAGGSRQDGRDRTGELYETERAGSDSAMGCGVFTSTLLVPNISHNTLF